MYTLCEKYQVFQGSVNITLNNFLVTKDYRNSRKRLGYLMAKSRLYWYMESGSVTVVNECKCNPKVGYRCV